MVEVECVESRAERDARKQIGTDAQTPAQQLAARKCLVRLGSMADHYADRAS